jgi:hypothetical protein
MKPKLKPPGTKRLKLKFDILLPTPAFKFNLRRYNLTLTLILGRALQVDPIKPELKPPGTQHLKLQCDILLSTFAFKFKLRRFTSPST